ncbi:hypothetical protein TOPH_02399, partial [Tolypocladium ophioglossoides CBS 100239]
TSPRPALYSFTGDIIIPTVLQIQYSVFILTSKMSQQGGTYRVLSGADIASRSKSSPPAASKDDGKTDSQEWEVVTSAEANNETNTHTKRTSTHFDIQLGFGRWKWTLFSWDTSTESSACRGTHR